MNACLLTNGQKTRQESGESKTKFDFTHIQSFYLKIFNG